LTKTTAKPVCLDDVWVMMCGVLVMTRAIGRRRRKRGARAREAEEGFHSGEEKESMGGELQCVVSILVFVGLS
jgi:hypothetical protein